MVRDRRLLVLPMFIILCIAGIIIWQSQRAPESKPLPQPETTQPSTEPKWYIKFSVNNQKSTYYTESVRAPASASAKGYFVGSAAVHPMYPLNAGGDARKPIIPFGTTIYLSAPIQVQGETFDSLTVNDTGDVYYGLWRKYPYWVDVFSGYTNYNNDKAANEAGVKMINYYWYEPWN